MPRKQRFKPSRKPKPVEPHTDSTSSASFAPETTKGTMQSTVTETAMPPPRTETASSSNSEP